MAGLMAVEHGDDGWQVADVTGIMANPFYAIEIDPSLAVPHEPLLSEEKWIAINKILIRDLGPESYLRNLLAILKGNYVKGEGDQFGYAVCDAGDHAETPVEVLDRYVAKVIDERLEREPNVLVRSMAALRAAEPVDQETLDEVFELESDPEVLAEAIGLTSGGWDSISDNGRRLVVRYLIDSIVVGAPHLPLDEQVTINWRVPAADG
jgi:hypothetical protein